MNNNQVLQECKRVMRAIALGRDVEIEYAENLFDKLSVASTNEPFTDKERDIMDLIISAHNKFIEIERTHPMEVTEWVDAIHRLQDLLGARVLRRDYPDTFPILKTSDG